MWTIPFKQAIIIPMQVEDFPRWFKNRYKRTSSFLSGFLLLLVDLLTIMLCIGISFFLINLINTSFINFKSFVNYWIYLPAFFLVFYVSKLYPGMLLAPAEEISRFTVGSFFCFIGIAFSIIFETDGRATIAIAMIIAIPFASLGLPLARQFARILFSRSRVWGVPVAVYVFDNEKNIVIDRLIHHPELGYKPAIIINTVATVSRESQYEGIPEFPPSPEIHDIIKKLNIKVAIIIEKKEDTLMDNQDLFIKIMKQYRYTIAIPYNQHIRSVYSSVRDFNGIIGFSTTRNLTRPGELFLKRLTDLLLLAIAAIPTLLVTLVLAVAIKISSPGPVFYGHKRVGKNGKEITVWKFRSMITNSQEILEKILAEDPVRRAEWEKDRKFKDDPRVTKIGKILRNTSLDELPQLWNILTGDMSFVGPRPVTRSELDKYGKRADFILSVKPGLSGMWQISGRSDTAYEERINLDTYYIQNWSIWLDLWIITKTVWVVLKGKGAY